jgi:hypothetical protein
MTSKAAQTHENRCRGLPPVALTQNGKEGSTVRVRRAREASLSGSRVQDYENARYSLAEIEHRPPKQLAAVGCDARLPVIPVVDENLALVGVELFRPR